MGEACVAVGVAGKVAGVVICVCDVYVVCVVCVDFFQNGAFFVPPRDRLGPGEDTHAGTAMCSLNKTNS